MLETAEKMKPKEMALAVQAALKGHDKQKDADEEAAKEARRKSRRDIARLLRDAARMWEEEATESRSHDTDISLRGKALRARVLAREAENGRLCMTKRNTKTKGGK